MALYKNGTLVGNWREDRLQQPVDFNALRTAKPNEPRGPDTKRCLPDFGVSREDTYTTTSKLQFEPPVALSSPGSRRVLAVPNFFTEVEKDRAGGPAPGTFGSNLPAHSKAEHARHFETSYKSHYCSEQKQPQADSHAAAPPATTRQRFVGGKPVPPEHIYRPLLATLTKGEWETKPPPQPKSRRGPFTRYPEESGCAYGEQTWFKP